MAHNQDKLTHADQSGHVRMVDVSAKMETSRQARARGVVQLSQVAAAALRTGSLPKGDGLAVARVAAIAAVKRTPDWIPLCHPISVDGVEVSLEVEADRVEIEVSVTSVGRTGAEMEALTGVAAAGLTIIDMVKAIDRQAVISDVRVVAKSGGRTGAWSEESAGLSPRSGDQVCGPGGQASGPNNQVSGPGGQVSGPDNQASGPGGQASDSDGRSSGSGEPHHDGQPSCDQAGRSGLLAACQSIGVVIVSDRRSRGLALDETGPLIAQRLLDAGVGRVVSRVVADEAAAIADAVRELAGLGCRVVITSGGTGLGPRDRTPEALAGLIDQMVPGVAEAIREAGRQSTPLAALSRQVVGVMRQGVGRPVVLVALPGAVAAVEVGLTVLLPLLGHLCEQVDGGDHG